ncbi:LPXTG cell wall anchor domain-containing protein [Enterococcus hailinensis]|uniref:LPXTG cell wall anchor domain-containing protein n=1 Tax=Enterococcus hailinensis TaxID=3238988 RepID=UPI0038B2EFF9
MKRIICLFIGFICFSSFFFESTICIANSSKVQGELFNQPIQNDLTTQTVKKTQYLKQLPKTGENKGIRSIFNYFGVLILVVVFSLFYRRMRRCNE